MAANDSSSLAIAMVATSNDRLPDGVKIRQAVQGWLPAQAADPQWDDGILMFPVAGGSVAVSLMPAPIPWPELEGPCATAWWWPDATKVMRLHTSHFLIAFTGGAIEAVERRVVLTNVVRAVLKGTDCDGVYWAEGTLVRAPEDFIELTDGMSVTAVQASAWIDIRIQPLGQEALRCFTTGLSRLGFLEIEVQRSTMPPEDLFAFINDVATYIINQRLHIKHDETMGWSATEQYRVRHAPSMLGRGKVMYLELA